MHAKRPTEQSSGCRFGDLADIGGRDVEESGPRVRRKDLDGGVQTPFACPLDQSDNDAHRGRNHPTNLSDTHKAMVDACSTGGTVTTPRRRNSEVGSSSPRLRGTRRQSRVASEPT